ncbi:MAG: hypothetical protein U0175_26490 [Caldilineaceae bacterium]
MKVNQYILPSFSILALLVTVLIADLTGQWIISGKELVDVNNMTTSEDIRGWMTLQQVADGFALEPSTLYQLLALPADVPTETALKDLEGIVPDFEVTTVREVLAVYLGETDASATGATVPDASNATPQPPESSTPVALPSAAKTDTNPEATAEPTHIPFGDGSGTGPTPLAPGEILSGVDIKGRQTLSDIAEQAQVPLEKLLAALGLPADTDTTQEVRALVEQGKVAEIDTVRSAVTALQEE